MPGDLLVVAATSAPPPPVRSMFPPLAVGFFGLGVGYLIYGPQELFGFPRRSPEVDRTTGLWGIWMPGFMQALTGVLLFVALSWFGHFGTMRPLYMAALAFTAYGVHWFAIGRARYLGSDPRPNGLMAVPFTIISVLGIVVFFSVGDWAVGILFCGLTLVYVTDFFASIGLWGAALFERALGAVHILTGLWLMYLTWGTVLDLALGRSVPT